MRYAGARNSDLQKRVRFWYVGLLCESCRVRKSRRRDFSILCTRGCYASRVEVFRRRKTCHGRTVRGAAMREIAISLHVAVAAMWVGMSGKAATVAALADGVHPCCVGWNDANLFRHFGNGCRSVHPCCAGWACNTPRGSVPEPISGPVSDKVEFSTRFRGRARRLLGRDLATHPRRRVHPSRRRARPSTMPTVTRCPTAPAPTFLFGAPGPPTPEQPPTL